MTAGKDTHMSTSLPREFTVGADISVQIRTQAEPEWTTIGSADSINNARKIVAEHGKSGQYRMIRTSPTVTLAPSEAMQAEIV